MADNFAARQCNRYTVVCTAPDVCMTPSKYGYPVPYISSIPLDNAVSVAKKTFFNSNNAFMYDQSITPNTHGDKAGRGKGVFSKTHYKKGRCIPTSSSPDVYIEGKLLVVENCTFDMNVGKVLGKDIANTVGTLVCTDTGDSPPITTKGIKVSSDDRICVIMPEGCPKPFVGPKPQKSLMERLQKSAKEFKQSITDWSINAGNTNTKIVEAFLEPVGENIDDAKTAYGRGDYTAVGVAAVKAGIDFVDPLKKVKAIQKGDEVLEKVEDAKDKVEAIASGDPSALNGSKKNKGKKKASTSEKPKKEESTGGKVKALTKKQTEMCGDITTFGESKKNAINTSGQVQFDRDHIPASSYMVEKARQMVKNDPGLQKFKMNGCVEDAIVNNAKVILIPQPIHSLGWTYGVDKKTMVDNGDLELTPKQAADRDIMTYRNMLKSKGATNKKDTKLTPKDRKKRRVANKKCKEGIEDGLKMMEQVKHEEFLINQIKNNQKC